MADSDSGNQEQGSDAENDGFRGWVLNELESEDDEEVDDQTIQVMDASSDSHSEDLQVDVVPVQNEVPNADEFVFDDDIPLEHRYLGSNLELLSGRVILTEGSLVWLPLLPGFYGALLPGQTLPLTVRHNVSVQMLRKCVSTNHTFGCVAKSYTKGIGPKPHGTTVEIYEFADNADLINVKAKARQRFKLLKTRSHAGYLLGFIKILPEVILDNPLCLIQSLGRYRHSKRQWCRRQEAQMTVWPSWVYDMYDPDKLVQRAHTDLSFLNQGLRKESGKGEVMPYEVSQLSFWIGTHLDMEKRMFLITLNSPIQRLRWQLSSMTKDQEYVCSSCESQVATQNEVFAMSTEGALSTYVNPFGLVHDTLTFRKVKNISVTTHPSTEYSWFPGYAWSTCICTTCRRHLGWKFNSVNRRTIPKQFYGLTRSALQLEKAGLEPVV